MFKFFKEKQQHPILNIVEKKIPKDITQELYKYLYYDNEILINILKNIFPKIDFTIENNVEIFCFSAYQTSILCFKEFLDMYKIDYKYNQYFTYGLPQYQNTMRNISIYKLNDPDVIKKLKNFIHPVINRFNFPCCNIL